MKKVALMVAVVAMATCCIQGCIPPQTVVDAGETTDKTGEIALIGSLLTTAEKSAAVDEEILKGGGFPTLTHGQWAEIINAKAAQVSAMNVRLVRENDGVVVYYDDSPVVAGSFNTLIRGIEAGTYILTIGFESSNGQWLFSTMEEKVDVAARTTTNATVVVYLNNYCQKQIRITGLDPAVAQFATPTLVVDYPGGGNFTIIGEGIWFSEDPGALNVVFRNNLAFDVPQPMTLTFVNAEGRPLAAMQLEFDPVVIAGWDLTVPFMPIDLGDLSVTVQTAPPMGVTY